MWVIVSHDRSEAALNLLLQGESFIYPGEGGVASTDGFVCVEELLHGERLRETGDIEWYYIFPNYAS